MMYEIVHSLMIALVSAFGLIVLAKIILTKLIRKEPDYYERDEVREEYDLLVEAGIITVEKAPEAPAPEDMPEVPEASDVQEAPAAPDESEVPEETKMLETPDAPEETKMLAASDAPDAPERVVYAVLSGYDPERKIAVVLDGWPAGGKEERL